MNNELISVLLSVYNREQYLRKCIDSVLSQDVNLEFIIVDDGSTDGSGEICDEYARDNDCITVVHQKNQGISVARNVAIDMAKGEFIFFLDSDDFLPKDSLKTLYELHKEHDADCVMGNYACYNDDGEFQEVIELPAKYSNKILSKRETCEMLFYSGTTHVLMVSWAKLYKKSIWDGIRFPADIDKSEDQFVFPALMEKTKKMYYTDKVVYNQVFSANSITRTGMFTRRHLYHPEGIAVVIDYLMDQGFYDIALHKFGVGSRTIIDLKGVLKDEECVQAIKQDYKTYCDIAKRLSRHLGFGGKLRMLLFRINLDLYAFVRKSFSSYK
ncbi:glycosyltransferase family 2 protein [Butyrivibrio sp. MC2021]|uniref:glycosyltransferase family 2 protein n=1 Tax=Butyrivibrio sp. MC2021 TaxID=1408306 RepID=UPI0006885637|nr:glycosyltransferase family 2 protein [Butyrivibrio sp. MC2021]